MKTPKSVRYFCPASALRVLTVLSMVGALEAQGPYYPVTNSYGPDPYAGAIPMYGSTYTGTPIFPTSPDAHQDLALVEGLLPSGFTIRKPAPTGKTLLTNSAPHQAILNTAVKNAALAVIAGTAPTNVTLETLASELIAYRNDDRAVVATALGNAIVTATAPPGLTVQDRVDAFKGVMTGLSKEQANSITTTVPSLFQQAGSLQGTAMAMGEIVAAGVVNLSADDVRLTEVVRQGLTALSGSVLDAPTKSATYLGSYMTSVIGSVPVTSARLVEDVTNPLFNNLYLGMVNGGTGTPLQQVIDAALSALNPSLPVDQHGKEVAVGAVLTSALRGQASQAAAIATRFGAFSVAQSLGTKPYTDTMVKGYTAASASWFSAARTVEEKQNYDAAAAGAIVKGVSGAAVLQAALKPANGNTAPVKDVVQAAVAANLAAASATVVGAIDGTTKNPWSGTWKDVAEGALLSARSANAGAIVQVLVSKTYTLVHSIPSAKIQEIIDGAITGAYDSGKGGTVASMMYSSMYYVKSSPGSSAAYVGQAMDTVKLKDSVDNTFIPVLAALAADTSGQRRTEIQDAATAKLASYPPDPEASEALSRGMSLVQSIQIGGSGLSSAFNTILTAFKSAANDLITDAQQDNSILAIVYGASLVNSSTYASTLASAIKFNQNIALEDLKTATLNGTITAANIADNVRIVAEVANHAKSINSNDILDFIGQKMIANPTYTKDIASAWTVIDPNHAHWVAHAVGFNNPSSASTAITEIFRVAQITVTVPNVQGNFDDTGSNINRPSDTTAGIVDRPAAAAAITAGVVTGILETNNDLGNPTLQASVQASLVSAVYSAVAASISQGNILLKGPTIRQSTGLSDTDFSPKASVGAAGAVTGFMAQLTSAGDTRLTDNPMTIAVLSSAANAARAYVMEMAQAAAQAFRWVAGASTNLTALQDDIWAAVGPYVGTFANEDKIKNAVAFGVSEADPINGRLGAGALGLNSSMAADPDGLNPNTAFYLHRSATGTPVTDIFNL